MNMLVTSLLLWLENCKLVGFISKFFGLKWSKTRMTTNPAPCRCVQLLAIRNTNIRSYKNLWISDLQLFVVAKIFNFPPDWLVSCVTVQPLSHVGNSFDLQFLLFQKGWLSWHRETQHSVNVTTQYFDGLWAAYIFSKDSRAAWYFQVVGEYERNGFGPTLTTAYVHNRAVKEKHPIPESQGSEKCQVEW